MNVASMEFEGEEVRYRRTDVNAGHGRDRATDVVWREHAVVRVVEITNLLRFSDTARLRHVRGDEVDSPLFEEITEAVTAITVLSVVADITILEDLDTGEYFTVEENGNFARLDY